MTYSAEPTYEFVDRCFFKAPGREHQVRIVVEASEFEDARDASGKPFSDDDATTLFAAVRHFRGNTIRLYLAVPNAGALEVFLASADEESCQEMFESLFELGVKYRLARKLDWTYSGETIH